MKLQDLSESKAKEQLKLVELPYGMSALEPIMERKVLEFLYDLSERGEEALGPVEEMGK